VLGAAREIAERAQAEGAQPRGALRAHAPHALHRERREEGRHGGATRGDDEAVGLLEVARDLRDELALRHARRRREAELGADGLADGRRDGRSVAEERAARGHVEEGLVQREPLDERRVAAEDLEHVGADLGVARAPRRHDDRLGASPEGLGHGHRGAGAPRAGRVRRRGDHAAARRAADQHGLAAEARVVELFDRREEGVHVDVEDVARHVQPGPRSRRLEAGSVRGARGSSCTIDPRIDRSRPGDKARRVPRVRDPREATK